MTRAEELLMSHFARGGRPVYVARINGTAATWSTSRKDCVKRAPEGAIIARERAA